MSKRRVLIVTGSRSEFGLLRPVIDAVKKDRRLALQIAVAGEHLLGPAFTWREVERAYGINARVSMQRSRDNGRAAHAEACGRGVEGFARAFGRLKPEWVVVLGDRVEAFAAASAASIAGLAVCHIHGGDRAEGIADEAMRHAITKLAHLHCAATELSAERIVKMGEPERLVHVTGSPAIDGLEKVKPLSVPEWKKLGAPKAIAAVHPSGLPEGDELAITAGVLGELDWTGRTPAIVLLPNSDPGHQAIRETVAAFARGWGCDDARSGWRPNFLVTQHLPRLTLLRLMKRLAMLPRQSPHHGPGVMIGNSSAGLIEAAALGLPFVNVGPRQNGRERGDNVIDCPYTPDAAWAAGPLEDAINAAALLKPRGRHPYGDGRAGPRIAALLAKTDPRDPGLLRKRIAY